MISLLLIGIGYTLLPQEKQDEPLVAQKTVKPQTEAPKAEPEPQAEEPQQQLAKAEVQPSQKPAKKQRKVVTKLVELIPASEELIQQIDTKQHQIEINLPQGILEL